MVHLDTDVVIAYLRGNHAVAERIRAASPNVGISTLVLSELLLGAELSARAEENRTKVVQFFSFISMVPFDVACAATCAEIKARLRRIGKPTGEVDALIAATASTHHAILSTHNRKHDENIEGLEWEDWLV